MGKYLFIAAACVAVLSAGCDSVDPKVREALAYVRNQQKDPDATKFQNVKLCNNGFGITGEVLGKNSYGAYTGWHKFYGSSVHVVIEGDDNYDRMAEEERECDMTPKEWSAYMDRKSKEYDAAHPADTDSPVTSRTN